MKKYIFIDFDGVLNTERHHANLVAAGKKTFDEFGPLFDPKSADNMGKIGTEDKSGRTHNIYRWN